MYILKAYLAAHPRRAMSLLLCLTYALVVNRALHANYRLNNWPNSFGDLLLDGLLLLVLLQVCHFLHFCWQRWRGYRRQLKATSREGPNEADEFSAPRHW